MTSRRQTLERMIDSGLGSVFVYSLKEGITERSAAWKEKFIATVTTAKQRTKKEKFTTEDALTHYKRVLMGDAFPLIIIVNLTC